MRRFIDVVRALIASGERTFWLAAMAVQPLLTQLLKRKYTASGTDAELERFFERHFVSGDRGESDWLAREISDQEIHDILHGRAIHRAVATGHDNKYGPEEVRRGRPVGYSSELR